MSDRLFERAVHDWLEDGSDRPPPTAIDAVLFAIKSTPQQRDLRILRRYTPMPSYLRYAAAAAIVAVIGVGALTYFGGGPSIGGKPTPEPAATQTTAPTAAPSPTSLQTARPEPTTYVPGALTQTFTSDVHGVSLNYPDGWAARAATEPWTEGGPPNWSDPTGDKVHDDAALQDHLFLTIVSRPLDGASLDEWFTEFFADQGCTPRAGGSINGADRVLRGDCSTAVALASSGGRGYVFELRASGDDVELRTLDTVALLDAILATVQLHPDDAVDE